MPSIERQPFKLNRTDSDAPVDEQAYLEAMGDLRRGHNQWRGMMRLALWAAVLALLFTRLDGSPFAIIVALIGFACGVFAFVKSWRIRRRMIRLRDQHQQAS